MQPITIFSFADQVDNIKKTFPIETGIGTVFPLSLHISVPVLKDIVAQVCTPYVLCYTKQTIVHIETFALKRMTEVAEATGAFMVYGDYFKEEEKRQVACRTIEYQPGSLRDDFDFGPAILYRTQALKNAVAQMEETYRYAVLYDLRLRLSRAGLIIRIPEFLSSYNETDHRLSGEKQFDYVDPKNRAVQIEMEQACTAHLKAVGGWLKPGFAQIDLKISGFTVEATIVIPVKNRIKTVADAVHSALAQQTGFDFNVIVVDNHSDDGTTRLLQELSAADSKLIHVIPGQTGLGIGGCWMIAVTHPACGKFAVQLDSDDLYIDNRVLQTVVDGFYEQNCAMLIGSYRMVNFALEEIPPGVIDHSEWTPDNGRNNALRINGLGAPRAFFTPVLRETGIPNVSYGEDYAVGLAISRKFRIGRIYTPLYLCRRWQENSDSNLDSNTLNRYNFYKDKLRTIELIARQQHVRATTSYGLPPAPCLLFQLYLSQLESFELARKNYDNLKKVIYRTISFDGFDIRIQYNPDRMISTAAKTDAQALKERKCFLCPENMPEKQTGLDYSDKYRIYVNPYPIFERHFTIPAATHSEQLIAGRFGDMLSIAEDFQDYTVFYNGPESGASAPDHFHFQMVPKGMLLLEQEVCNTSITEIISQRETFSLLAIQKHLRKAVIIQSDNRKALSGIFERIVQVIGEIQPFESEPMINLFVWLNDHIWTVCVIPRKQLRPWQFFAEEEEKILFSPGCVDMAGVIIAPRKEDFEKYNRKLLTDLIGQVVLPDETWQTCVQRLRTEF